MVERGVDEEAVGLLVHYRDELAMKRMVKDGGICKRSEVNWVGREGLNADTHKTYLLDFVSHFYKNVVKLIDRAMKKEISNSSSTKVALEILFHLHECNRSRRIFLGREQELGRLRAYLQEDSALPMVLWGEGGSGKTALLAQAAWLARSSQGCPVVVVRFCGTSPDSNSVVPLLQSVCHQLSYNFNLSSGKVPTEQAPLVIYLKQLLGHATAKQPVHVFLDAVDELGPSPAHWLPASLPAHCKLVISVTSSACLPEVQDQPSLEVTSLGPQLGLELVYHLLKLAGRTVSNYHNRLVLNALERCSLPIFCVLVFAEIRYSPPHLPLSSSSCLAN